MHPIMHWMIFYSLQVLFFKQKIMSVFISECFCSPKQLQNSKIFILRFNDYKTRSKNRHNPVNEQNEV